MQTSNTLTRKLWKRRLRKKETLISASEAGTRLGGVGGVGEDEYCFFKVHDTVHPSLQQKRVGVGGGVVGDDEYCLRCTMSVLQENRVTRSAMKAARTSRSTACFLLLFPSDLTVTEVDAEFMVSDVRHFFTEAVIQLW